MVLTICRWKRSVPAFSLLSFLLCLSCSYPLRLELPISLIASIVLFSLSLTSVGFFFRTTFFTFVFYAPFFHLLITKFTSLTLWIVYLLSLFLILFVYLCFWFACSHACFLLLVTDILANILNFEGGAPEAPSEVEEAVHAKGVTLRKKVIGKNEGRGERGAEDRISSCDWGHSEGLRSSREVSKEKKVGWI